MHHAFKFSGEEHAVELSRSARAYRLHLDGHTLDVNLAGNDGDGLLSVDGEMVPVVIATRGDAVYVHLDGAAYELRYEHPLERLAHEAQGAHATDRLTAPMPGSLVAVHVAPGQRVARGEALLVMESMKMETTLTAPRDGVVEMVHFAAGQSFERDAVLLEFEDVE